MSVLSIFTAIEKSPIGQGILASAWLFPAIEAVHLLALSVIGGAVLVVNFRLLGIGIVSQPVSRIARSARPWMNWSLVVMLITGFLLFTSEATKCYYHFAFWFKMTCLLLACTFTYTLYKKVVMEDAATLTPFRAKLAALTSIVLWTGVGIGGRWIGFS
jgi:uncharacterized membrane protein YhdT